jgi:S-layer family protein
MKKVLSLVLVIAMVLSSMSFAFAGTFEDVADTDYAKAIETLTALGVVTGYEDGTYRPEKTITRAEMAKLMVITLGYGDLVAGSKSNFADTQGHWADAYIALAAGKGIVVGTGDGKFAPDRTVSYDEVYTMLVRGLGYTDSCNELKGMTWPTNFKVKAAELGITKSVGMSTTGADRGGVAQAIFNALEATLVSVDTDGNVVNILDRNKAGVELLSRIADLDENFVVTEEVLDPDNKDYAGNLVDLEPYMFQDLKVYLNDDDEVVYVKSSNSLTFEGEFDSLKVDGTGLVLSVIDENNKTKKYTFKTTTGTDTINADELFVNGEIKEVSGVYNDLKNAEYVKVVANEVKDSALENGKIDKSEIAGFVISEQTKVGRVEKEYVDGKSKLDVFSLPVDSDDDVNVDQVTVVGDATSLEDIKADDIVVEYAAFDSDNDVIQTKLVVTRNSVEGKITRVDGSDKVYVDGKYYELSGTRGAVSGLLLGDEGVFYLDQDGLIADYDGESAGPTNYAVVIDTAKGSVDDKFTSSKSIDDYPQIKLATQADEEVAYDVQVKISSSTGAVTSSAKVGTADIVANGTGLDAGKLTVNGIATNDLVKYSINSDGRISKIEKVINVGYLSAETTKNIDLDKSSNKLASNVVIFDATDGDYAVVEASALPTEFIAYADRNSNGEIKVLVVKSGEINTAADRVYAYINKFNAAYDADGDEVQMVVVYTDGV